jgi:isoleucyl-tRNA synthetase
MYQNLVKGVDSDAPESIHLCDFPVWDKDKRDPNLEEEVVQTRTIVSLGRAARNKVNIKIRQPLSEMVINLPEGSRWLSEDDQLIVTKELNVKKITGMSNSPSSPNVFDGKLEHKVIPDFTKLGPKFGKSINKLADWIKSINQDEIQKLKNIGSLKIELNGKVFEIKKDDVTIKEVEKQGWSVVAVDEFGVGINTTITEELENEGLVRELIHKIQLMRKQADFNLIDRIKIYYQTGPKLKEAIRNNLEYLKNETLAVEVVDGEAKGDITDTLNINGIETKISLQKV